MWKYSQCKSFVNPLSIEVKIGNKYLIYDDSANENKPLLKKYTDVWNGMKNKIKAINGGVENNYGKVNLILMMTCH